jgi:hypothetical protein
MSPSPRRSDSSRVFSCCARDAAARTPCVPAEERAATDLPLKSDSPFATMSAGELPTSKPLHFAPFHFTRDEAVGICVAKGERFLRCAHEREITNPISKHQRAAGERTQDVDDHRYAARLRGAREQAPSFNSHCLQF